MDLSLLQAVRNLTLVMYFISFKLICRIWCLCKTWSLCDGSAVNKFLVWVKGFLSLMLILTIWSHNFRSLLFWNIWFLGSWCLYGCLGCFKFIIFLGDSKLLFHLCNPIFHTFIANWLLVLSCSYFLLFYRSRLCAFSLFTRWLLETLRFFHLFLPIDILLVRTGILGSSGILLRLGLLWLLFGLVSLACSTLSAFEVTSWLTVFFAWSDLWLFFFPFLNMRSRPAPIFFW